jgi:simple sugar transport system permease protein
MDFLIHWVAAVPSYTAPLLIACLGLIINERAGVLNLGAEGMMVCGALAGAAISLNTGLPSIGVIAAMLAGTLIATLFAFMTIILRANQVISGLIIVALGAGITGVLGGSIINTPLPGFQNIDWGVMSDVPFIGPIIFNQNALTYLAFVLAGLIWIFLFKTTTGLRVRAVGEDPATADASGVNVVTVRILAVMAGGALCGLAGGYLSLASSFIWVEGMTGGRGWIAIGLVIFARWDPKFAVIGALLFGAIEALIPRIQTTGIDVPIYLMMMLPYIATLGVLIFASLNRTRRTDEPGSLGIPYARQDRQ